MGMISHPSIYCDGKEIARLHRGSVFTAELPRGKHMITGGRSEVGLPLDMESGKAYYVRFDFRESRNLAAAEPFTLTLIPEAQALHEMAKLKTEGN